MLDTAVSHIGLHAQDKVIDDAVAILHDSGADLYVSAAQLDKLQRVAPSHYATDTTVLHCLYDGVGGHLVDETQRDRLDCLAAISRYGKLIVYCCLCRHCHALNGIDGGDSIGTGKIAPHGRLVDLCDIRSHLRDDRDADIAFHIGRVERDEFGILPNVAAQT